MDSTTLDTDRSLFRNFRIRAKTNKYFRFDVQRATHCNIIPTEKPTRCTSVSNLFILE